jgi:hypothetical protein
MKKRLLQLTTCLATLGMFTQSNAQTRYLDEIFNDNDVIVTENIKYGENYGVITGAPEMQDLFLDVYEPSQSVDTETERPVIILLHTGNFLPPVVNGTQKGAKNDSLLVELGHQWAKRGYVVASVGYRLGWNPISGDVEVRRSTLLQAVYRAIIDTKTAIRYFRKDAAEDGNTFAIDSEKMMVFGQGSGGYVALGLAHLDKESEMNIPKFTWAQTGPNGEPAGSSYVNPMVWGGIDGFGGLYNHDNHVGYNADVDMVANIGGALADLSWVDAGEPAVVSFQCVRDPLAPYQEGIVIVAVTGEDVVDVHGAGAFMPVINQLGNNDAFANVDFNDSYTLTARSRYNLDIEYFLPAPLNTINTGSGEGLFPIIRPLQANQFDNESSPWEWEDSSNTLAQGMAYIDTINGYLHPRIMKVLELPGHETVGVENTQFNAANLSVFPNPTSNNLFIQAKDGGTNIQAVQIFDISGRLHLNKSNLNLPFMQLDVTNYASGIYIVNISTNQGVSQHKIVVE